MSATAPDPSRVTPEGWAFSRPVRMVGEPFRITANPPGCVWQAAVCADGKMRPVMMPREEEPRRPPQLLMPTPGPAGTPAFEVGEFGSTFTTGPGPVRSRARKRSRGRKKRGRSRRKRGR